MSTMALVEGEWLTEDSQEMEMRAKRDIDLRFDSKWQGKCTDIWVGNRIFLLLNDDYARHMSQVDKPKTGPSKQYLQHTSEKGRRLSKYDHRHFLRLPNEIKDKILKFALSVPSDIMIRPNMFVSNWKKTWKLCPDFTLKSKSIDLSYLTCHNEDVQIVQTQRQTKSRGTSTKYILIIRAMIDATCLRTSRALRDYGARILYGENTFAFGMASHDGVNCPPYLINEGDDDPFWPWKDPYKPDRRSPSIRAVMNQMLDRSLKPWDLPGWAYYDQFLRFLFTIGPANSALLKHLRFSGVAKQHLCEYWVCGNQPTRCDDDLISSLKIYVLFIRKFCTSLETLSIIVSEDEVYNKLSAEGMDVRCDDFTSTEDALVSLLEKEVRGIWSLKKVEVMHDGSFSSDNEPGTVNYTEKSTTWFDNRTKEREKTRIILDSMRLNAKPVEERAVALREELRNTEERGERARIIEELSEKCEMCAEEHMTAECWNLCNFCGGFGHWRDTCRALAREEVEGLRGVEGRGGR